MVIGIIGTVVLAALIIWQVFESKKSGLLRIARDAYEDRAVRYEGRVTYQKGPFSGIPAGSEVYLSVLDGVVCLTSRDRDFYAIEAAQIAGVASSAQSGRTAVNIRFSNEAGLQEVELHAPGERARMIERNLAARGSAHA